MRGSVKGWSGVQSRAAERRGVGGTLILPGVPVPVGVCNHGSISTCSYLIWTVACPTTLTLHKAAQDPTSSLQKWVTDNNLQEALQALSALFNNSIIEFVEVDLAGKRWNGNAGALALENVAEVFKV